MGELVPCAGCARHVRQTDSACPFCGERVSGRAISRRVARGATRAAIFYVGATLAGAGCDAMASMYGGPPEPPPETIAQPYGAPPDPPPETPPETPPLETPPEETVAPPETPPDPGMDPSGISDITEGAIGQPYGGGAIPPPRQQDPSRRPE